MVQSADIGEDPFHDLDVQLEEDKNDPQLDNLILEMITVRMTNVFVEEDNIQYALIWTTNTGRSCIFHN